MVVAVEYISKEESADVAEGAASAQHGVTGILAVQGAFAEHAAGSIRVSGNMWGSVEYRRALAPVLVRRALLMLGEVR